MKEEIKTNKGGTYTFKVSLSKTLWRKINLSYKHTFGDLHNSIQEAFEFDNEAPVPLKPMIIESKGKSPEQYRGGW